MAIYDTLGTIIVNRSGSNATQIYRNGILIQSPALASGGLVDKTLYLGTANNNGTNYADIAGKQYSILALGGSLTEAEAKTLSDAFAEYMELVTGWTRLADMPGVMEQHAVSNCGGFLYSMGGVDKKLYKYNLTTNTWETKTDLPFIGVEGQRQSSVLESYNGKLYFIGGNLGTFMTGECWEYTPETDSWSQKTSMPTAREDFGAALLDGKIYCMGGLASIDGSDVIYKKLEIYDIASDTWDTTKADMPDYKALGNFGAACNSKVYVIAGSNSMTGYPALHEVTAVYEYTPGTDTWVTKAPIPQGTCYKDVAVVGNKMYVISGQYSSTHDKLGIVQRAFEYDTTNNTWIEKSRCPYASLGSGVTVIDGKIYMCGGNKQGYTSPASIGDTAELWRWDV